ncbi:MAG: FlgD immunoglobulin-like domain containing protein [bacterium]
MRTRPVLLAATSLLAVSAATLMVLPRAIRESEPAEEPSEFFHLQRAWPEHEIPAGAYARAVDEARTLRAASLARRTSPVPWQASGPTNVGGRVTAIAVDPTNASRIWIGAADGGVFRTTNGGTNWTPLLDSFGGLSIGALAAHPTLPGVLLAGTGEANTSGDSYDGIGMLKTTDGGDTWALSGLPASQRIGRIAWDVTNPSIIHVAVAGGQYTKSPDRGVYRSTDGGATWQQTLFVSDSTSAIDVVIDPTNGSKVYAAMWERMRFANNRIVSGPTSGIYRSTDGGTTWAEMTTGVPITNDVARIGLAVAPSLPSTVYAVYSRYSASQGTFLDGVYKSVNSGASWAKVSNTSIGNPYSSYGWYFGEIRVAPTNPNLVLVLGVPLMRSTNGGIAWSDITGAQHVDMHDLWIDPANAAHWISGNDGGLYLTSTSGSSWTQAPDLPITQFYALTVDPQLPQRLIGGTQDNSTPRTLTGALNDWDVLIGGDGFTAIVDPTNSNVIYGETQYGDLEKTTNGFSFGTVFDGTGTDGRANWSMPVVMAPSDHLTLYAGTWRVWRTTNAGSTWTAISPDLTDGPGGGNLVFGTLTTLAVAPSAPGTIWAGADDGNVRVTTNGGGTWANVRAGLPVRWVTRVAADPLDATIGYVALSGYHQDETQPHLFRTTNVGATWTDISGNLPSAPVNDIVVDPQNTNRLFVGTDTGVYVTNDLGVSWDALGTGFPLTVVADLELHAATRTLVAGTHGRSSFKIDLDAVTAAPIVASAGATTLTLEAPRPNPSAGETRLAFALPKESRVRLAVYDVVGRRVRELLAETRSAGRHEVTWDGRDSAGHAVAAGVYFARLSAAGETQATRITRTR